MHGSLRERIFALASSQHGVVTRRQLLEVGLGPGAVRGVLDSGWVRCLHRGVYLVGPVQPRYAREMAAALACGREAFISHGSAAAIWGMVKRPDRRLPVEVTLAAGCRASREGIRVHRTRSLPEQDRTTLHRLPLTGPGRTLVDLSPRLRPRALELALARGEREGLVRPEELAERVSHLRRPGAARLRSVLALTKEPAFTRSEAEDRFLELVREAGLPLPRTNVQIGSFEVDFYWPEERIVVEVDGYRYHHARSSFERDRRRAVALAAQGVQVIRLTWRQIVERATATAVQVGQALARGRSAREVWVNPTDGR